MTERGDVIPIVETYRGVGIHDCQPAARIAAVVKPAIDAVLGLEKIEALADYAANTGNPPEARLLAVACVSAIWEMAAESREVRPNVDLTLVRASVAGLQSIKWRHPSYYGSLLDRRDPPGQRRHAMRETPLGQ